MIGIFSRGILKIPGLEAFLDEPVVRLGLSGGEASLSAVAGWGRRPSTVRARAYAARRKYPFISLEDGFLRSLRPGAENPPLSMVIDRTGIYYDATRSSDLESLLQSGADVLRGREADVGEAIRLVLAHRLAKYNNAPLATSSMVKGEGGRRVLVVDQTAGDASVVYGGASARTFTDMLKAARHENPGAVIFVKTHPEVSNGAKQGYLTDVQDDENTVVLRESVNPISLIEHMDHVYVVTSQMGFEALLGGKKVSCFGIPWYSGWGVTDDRQRCARRTANRSIEELFSAAYFDYTRYLDPTTLKAGTIFNVIDWLTRQRSYLREAPGRTFAVGYRRWKAANVRPFLELDGSEVKFVRDAERLALFSPSKSDRIVTWGVDAPATVREVADHAGAQLIRMEDGFVRSVGLGSDFISPMSLVLDSRGLYFDPRRNSDLEELLNSRQFSEGELDRAAQVRAYIVEHGITKYNIERRGGPDWKSGGAEVVLVPGQVEDDASIRWGCEDVKTNLDLLQQARLSCPDAYIVYKPHPDVAAKNRRGSVDWSDALRYADCVETSFSIVSCIDAADAIHTMTSLSGFDALLRKKRVTVYGRPFYAGWGPTEDRLPARRRQRSLSLDQLVAGALLHYPLYWDSTLKGATSCEAVLSRLVAVRHESESARAGGAGRFFPILDRFILKSSMWLRGEFRIADTKVLS